MNNTDINNHSEEQLIKEWFDAFEPESPKTDFTKQTMNKVMEGWVAQTQKRQSNYWSPILISLGIAVLIFMALFTDLNNLSKFDSRYFTGIHSIIESTITALGYLKLIPGTFYMIVVGGTILYWIDKLLKKKVSHT